MRIYKNSKVMSIKKPDADNSSELAKVTQQLATLLQPKNGKDGLDGRDVEMRATADIIQYRLMGEAWNTLISVADLKGDKGERGLDGKDGKDGKDAVGKNGIDGKNGRDGKDGEDGKDGSPLRLRKTKTHIQWKLESDANWNNLVSLQDLRGPAGVTQVVYSGGGGGSASSGEPSGGAVDSVNGQTGVVVLTQSDIGLANVDNTSDANKPVSTATQNALDDKVDVEAGKGLSANDFTDAAKEKLDGIASGVMARIFSPIKPSAQSGGFGYTFAGSIEFYNAGTYAIGDYAEFLVPLAAGNYDFNISYATFSSAGIIKLTVDGVDIGATIDAYSATTVRYLQTTRSSVAVAGGLTPIRIEVTGKNASSSNYRYIIQSILANKV